MPSCLGIYIDKNLIKYAKVKKKDETFKIETYNSQIFENLEDSLKKIIDKTGSRKCPICINISNELYNYFEVFSLLKKRDITKSLNIEFEILCNEKGYDINSLESRYILMENSEELEKFKAMYISTNKNELKKKKDLFSDYKLYSMTPVSTSITNLIEYNENENIAIINIENETQITIIQDGQIKSVNVLNKNLEEIIQNIRKKFKLKENCDVLKGITIYGKNDVHTLDEENKYLDMIIPFLYKTARETNKILKSYNEKINKIYITGMGASIENIDLYFQDFFKKVKCEILKPFFVEKGSEKKYVKVNSAISLALDGLGFLNKNLNFAMVPKSDNFTIENYNLKKNFNQPLDAQEKTIIRVMIGFIIAIIVFAVLGKYLVKKMNLQKDKINESLIVSTEQITSMEKEISQIESHTNAYIAMINGADPSTQTTLTNKISRVIIKDSIPNFLRKIMFIIPQRVQIISIRNTEGKHIIIEAFSDKYEQLIFFINNIKSDEVLQNAHSSNEETEDYGFKITIEGDLP